MGLKKTLDEGVKVFELQLVHADESADKHHHRHSRAESLSAPPENLKNLNESVNKKKTKLVKKDLAKVISEIERINSTSSTITLSARPLGSLRSCIAAKRGCCIPATLFLFF
jgi:hypothetical protein